MQPMINEMHNGVVIDLTTREPKMCGFKDCTLVAHNESERPNLGLGRNVYDHCIFIGTGWPEHIRQSGAWRTA